MRISDWSSDVCSSDLDHRHVVVTADVGDSCFLQIGHATLRGARERPLSPAARPAPTPRAHRSGKSRALRGGTEGAMPAPQGRNRRERGAAGQSALVARSEEHTSELQSLMRISYAVFCLQKKRDT